MPIAALVEQLLLRWSPDRQTAENERSSTEAEILQTLIAALPDQFDPLDLAQPVFRDQQFAMGPGEQIAGGLHHEIPLLKSRHGLQHSIHTMASRNAVGNCSGVPLKTRYECQGDVPRSYLD